METIRKTVRQKIIHLIKEFKKYPQKFLTEEDLRSYLYSLLLKEFNKIQKSIDNSEYLNVLVYVNHDEICGQFDQVAVITGQFLSKGESLYPIYLKYSEG